MSKSKPAASSTLSLLNQMSTERRRDAARKTAEKQAEAAKIEATIEEAAKAAELEKATQAEEIAKAQAAEKARQEEEAERARIQAEKEEAERLAAEKLEAERKAAEEAKKALEETRAAAAAEKVSEPEDRLTSVVKAGKTQFQSMVKERKNIRKNFLLTPSNSEHLREEAEELGTSMNDLLNLILEDRYN